MSLLCGRYYNFVIVYYFIYLCSNFNTPCGHFCIYVQVNQSSFSLILPPVLYYIVYHNVTSDGDQGIVAYDANVTIHVPNDLFGTNAVYSIQVAAVNVIGQGSLNEAILCKDYLIFSYT